MQQYIVLMVDGPLDGENRSFSPLSVSYDADKLLEILLPINEALSVFPKAGLQLTVPPSYLMEEGRLQIEQAPESFTFPEDIAEYADNPKNFDVSVLERENWPEGCSIDQVEIRFEAKQITLWFGAYIKGWRRIFSMNPVVIRL